MSLNCDYLQGMTPEALVLEGKGLAFPTHIMQGNPGGLMAHRLWAWRGQIGIRPGGSLVFLTPAYGIRALTITLVDLIEHHHLKTPRAVADKFSRADLIAKASLADYVARHLGVGIDSPLNFDSHARSAITAVIEHENGVLWENRPFRDYYAPGYIRDAIAASHIR